jgi:hypothetical protein
MVASGYMYSRSEGVRALAVVTVENSGKHSQFEPFNALSDAMSVHLSRDSGTADAETLNPGSFVPPPLSLQFKYPEGATRLPTGANQSFTEAG